MMQRKERIPKEIVEKYQDTIFFMVDTDQCLMEAIESRTSWIMPMVYEVEGHSLVVYAQHLLRKPMDKFKERFGTYKEEFEPTFSV